MKRGERWLIFALVVLLLIVNVKAVPVPDFTSPTSDSGAEITSRDLKINVSITESGLPSEIKLNLDNVNYSSNLYNLTLMYNFDNVSALGENRTHILDVSGRGHNGTAVNSSWNATGRYGGAFEFNSSGKSYIKTGLRNINIQDNFTISFWMKTTDTKYTFPMGVRDSGAGTFYVYIRAQIDTLNRLEFLISNGTTTLNARYDNQKWRDGTWHHLTFVKRGVTADGLYIYVDGSEATITRPNNGTVGSHTITEDFYVGALNSAGTAGGFINSSMDEIRFYNRSLNATEIMQNYKVNLNKYDTDKWNFYTDMYDLVLGNNNYSVAVFNSSGSENQTETRNITLLAITTQYYDNRKAVVVITADDYGSGDIDKHLSSMDYAQRNKVVISPAISTNYTNSSEWSLLQAEINEGFVFPSSHSVNHPHATSGNHTLEVCDSKTHILGNLTLPWQDTFNGSEFLVGWVEPYGETSAAQRGNLSSCNYLNDRSVSELETSFASWDTIYGLYNRMGVTIYGKPASTLISLNTNFTDAYSNGGIYHLWIHPWEENWTDTDVYPQHFSYMGNKTDIWYAGWGGLYAYHYLDERTRPTINVTYHDSNQMLVKVNASQAERNKYGLSYPLTYSFYLPESWNYAFALYKNTSSDNYTAMTEKTTSDYWNDIEAYRENASGSVIYVSKSFPHNYSEFYLKIIPIRSTNFNGLSTDLTTNLTAMNISNITNFILENSSYGKINFSESVNLSTGANLDRDVIISYKYISINTTSLPLLNKKATLSVYNLSFENPLILKDGETCPSSICQQINYSGGNLTFNVTGFSTYSINCSEPWTCTEWSSCSSEGIQTRVCTDANACGTIITKPAESQSCTIGRSGNISKTNNITGQNISEEEEGEEENGLEVFPQPWIDYAIWIAILSIVGICLYFILRKKAGKGRKN